MILSGGCSQLFHNLVLVDIQKTQIRKETHYKQVLIYTNTKQKNSFYLFFINSLNLNM